MRREPGRGAGPDDGPTGETPTPWERKVLYHHRIRTTLSNERKYVGWLGVSLGMITLGFVVERLDLLLAGATTSRAAAPTGVLTWAPGLIFGMGGVTIAVATWEFFADRRRIAAEEHRGSRLIAALVLVTLVSFVLIAALLWQPAR